MSKTKQILIIRADLKMRKGKIAAQAAHASMAVLTQDLITRKNNSQWRGEKGEFFIEEKVIPQQLHEWLKSSFKKVCVYVNSEQELLDVYNKAKEKGMLCSLITDNGATEFKGVPTITCCAIGPDYDEEFIGITDGLPLY